MGVNEVAEDLVLYDTREKVGFVTLNRPDKLNAISKELESADFSVIFWQPVTFAHGRESTARIAGRVR